MFNIDKKICLVKQPGGLGDIFYLQKLANHFKKQNYEIYWYVISKYYWIKEYMPHVNFKDKKSNDMYSPLGTNQPFCFTYNRNDIYQTNDLLLAPTLFAFEMSNNPNKKIMKSKYEIFGLNDDNWQEEFNFKRNLQKEDSLFYDKLGLIDGEEYCLISENITPHDNNKMNLNIDSKIKKIHLDFLKDFTLFDWCKVIENAAEIHTSDSAPSLLLEKLNLKTSEIFIYSRRNDFSEIDYLYSKEYKFKLL